MSNKATFLEVKGKVLYARVHKPQTYKGKSFFSLVFMPEDDDTRNKITEFLKEKNKLYSEQYQAKFIDKVKKPEDEILIGGLRVKTKFKPVVVDAQGNDIPEDILIGNNSIAKVKLRLSPFVDRDGSKHISLDFTGIQVIKLVEFNQGTEFSPTIGFTVSQKDGASTTTETENKNLPF